MKPHDYRDLIASYIDARYGRHGIEVYTEVSLGKTIIGKNRRLDIFALRPSDQRSLAIECKYQNVKGTADEKIPYALQDIEAMWVPGCVAYAGEGWSQGVLHTLEGSRLAVYCLPDRNLESSKSTEELDHIIAAVFGLWDVVIGPQRRFTTDPQLSLFIKGPSKVAPRLPPRDVDDTGSGE